MQMTTHTDDSLGSIPALPCPFCGGAPEFENTDERVRLRCTGCGTEGGVFFYSQEECDSGIGDATEARAIEAWNQRAAPSPAPAAAVRMLELVREYGESRWSEGCSAGTYLDRVGERRAREEAADLFKQIESAVNGLTLGAAAPAGGETTDTSKCMPEGLMFDAFGRPRRRYVRVIHDGTTCVVEPQDADALVDSEKPDAYQLKDVYLSKEEFDALPEFDGF